MHGDREGEVDANLRHVEALRGQHRVIAAGTREEEWGEPKAGEVIAGSAQRAGDAVTQERRGIERHQHRHWTCGGVRENPGRCELRFRTASGVSSFASDFTSTAAASQSGWMRVMVGPCGSCAADACRLPATSAATIRNNKTALPNPHQPAAI